MNERHARAYLKNRIDDLIVTAESRGSAIESGVPDAVVWVGLNERGTVQKLLPILIHSNIEDQLEGTVSIYKEFASSDDDSDRIVTPVYTSNPAKRDHNSKADPEYEVQSVNTSHPEVNSANWSGVQEYSDNFVLNAKSSDRIRPKIGVSEEGYVPLELRISAPGAIFETRIPFFLGRPSDKLFFDAVSHLVIPCIAVSNSTEANSHDSFPTSVKLPYVG